MSECRKTRVRVGAVLAALITFVSLVVSKSAVATPARPVSAGFHGLVETSSEARAPRWCTAAMNGPVVYRNRVQTCRRETFEVIFVRPWGKLMAKYVVGSVTWAEIQTASGVPTRNWRMSRLVWLIDATGDQADDGLQLRSQPQCSGCERVIDALDGDRFARLHVDGRRYLDAFGFVAPIPGSVAYPQLALRWVVRYPSDGRRMFTHGPSDQTHFWLRCDNILPGYPAGCVFPNASVPVWQISLSGATPQVARHIRDARVNYGINVGRPGYHYPLNRADAATVDANRAAARRYCANYLIPRPADTECDEWPVASGTPGSAALGPPPASSVRWIDAWQRRTARYRLGTFYARQRILPPYGDPYGGRAGDSFYIRVTQ